MCWLDIVVEHSRTADTSSCAHHSSMSARNEGPEHEQVCTVLQDAFGNIRFLPPCFELDERGRRYVELSLGSNRRHFAW